MDHILEHILCYRERHKVEFFPLAIFSLYQRLDYRIGTMQPGGMSLQQVLWITNVRRRFYAIIQISTVERGGRRGSQSMKIYYNNYQKLPAGAQQNLGKLLISGKLSGPHLQYFVKTNRVTGPSHRKIYANGIILQLLHFYMPRHTDPAAFSFLDRVFSRLEIRVRNNPSLACRIYLVY